MCACVRVCVRARMRVRVRVPVRVSVPVRVPVRVSVCTHVRTLCVFLLCECNIAYCIEMNIRLLRSEVFTKLWLRYRNNCIGMLK